MPEAMGETAVREPPDAAGLARQLDLLAAALAERHAFLDTPPLTELDIAQGDAGLLAWAIMAGRYPDPQVRGLLARWLREGEIEALEAAVDAGAAAPGDPLLEQGLTALGEMVRSGSLEERLAAALELAGEAGPGPLSGGSSWSDLAANLHPLDPSVPISGVIVPVAASVPAVFGSGSTGGLSTFGRLLGDELARDDAYQLVPTTFETGFDVDASGFTYADDAFRATAQPGYADGAYIGAGGFSGGALRVILGAIDDADILGMSGGWRYQLVLTQTSEVSVTFRYQLTHASEHEADEYAEALFSFDGTLYGNGANDYLARLTGDGNGGPDQTTGWQSFTVDLGAQAAGTYDIFFGGHSNKKTFNDEWTEVLIDEVSITSSGTLVVAADAGLLANDVAQNGLPLSALLDSAPANGSVSLAADGSFSYTPDVGFSGTDSFSYRVTDGLVFDSATVQLEVV